MIFDRKTLNHLFHYCLALCRGRDEASDLLQDAVEKYLTAEKSGLENHEAYVKRIARNRFFDSQRRRQVLQFDVLDDALDIPDSEVDLESIMVDQITLARVWSALSAAEREVVFLWAVEDLSASEIAEKLELPRATVLSRMRRLKLRMSGDAPPAKFGRRPYER